MLPLETAWLCVGALESYLAVGCLVAPILIFGLGARIDRGLPTSSVGCRLLLLPGSVLLWPFLLGRGLKGRGTPPAERNAHRIGAAS